MAEKMVAVPVSTLQAMVNFLASSAQVQIYESLKTCNVIEEPEAKDDADDT